MKRLGIILLATVGFAAMAQAAQAADLPTKKEEAPKPKPNCWASFWTWLNTSADDCPIGAYGITFYGTLDVGVGYQEWGARNNPWADKTLYGLNKAGHQHIWQQTYNGLSTNVLGLKMKEDLAPIGLPGWSLVGVLEAGIDPYSWVFFNGPKSLNDNNFRNSAGITTITVGKNKYFGYNTWQNTNLDSSRAGQWDNSQGYIGISNSTWGTLTFGRTNSLSNDVLSKYDPVASTAFSQIGFSCSFPGFGNTELCRINTALTYKVAIPNVWAFSTVRLAGQAQLGGYGLGNGANEAYYGQIGFDWGNFSFDGVVGWAQDAVSLSNYNGSFTACSLNTTLIQQNYGFAPGYGCYPSNNILKATLSNNFGTQLTASYKWDRFRFYGGWIYANLSNPSDAYAGGFETIASGIFVPPGAVTSTAYPTPYGSNNFSSPAYPFNRKLQTVWTGFRYSIPDEWMHGWGSLDFAMGVYYQWQNNYNFYWNNTTVNGVPYSYATSAGCFGTGAFIQTIPQNGNLSLANIQKGFGNGSKCAGALDAVSFMLDWKPAKRVDIYAGVMIQSAYGGLNAGYFNQVWAYTPTGIVVSQIPHAFNQTYDPTVGIRIRF